MKYGWKNKGDGHVHQNSIADTPEQLLKMAGVKAADQITSWTMISVTDHNGKWVEHAEVSDADRIWDLLVKAAKSS